MSFILSRDTPPQWQAELEAIVPRSDRLNWLQIVWEPGLHYEPVQRWTIYEMVPRVEFVPTDVLEDLRGQNPREWGVWKDDPDIPQRLGGKRWYSHSLVSLNQWLLYRATGCYSQRFWVIQGTKGGHKVRLSAAEANHLAAFGGTIADSGDLPYAEWDRRTARQIGEFDRLRQWKMRQAFDTRQETRTAAGLYVQRDRHAEEVQYSEAMMHWLDSQIEDAVSEIPNSMMPGFSDMVPGDTHYNKDAEALERELVLQTASATRENV